LTVAVVSSYLLGGRDRLDRLADTGRRPPPDMAQSASPLETTARPIGRTPFADSVDSRPVEARRAGELRVTVSGPDAAPLPAAVVSVEPPADERIAASDGTTTLRFLGAWTGVVTVTLAGYASETIENVMVGSEDSVVLDVVLRKGASLRIAVRDPLGLPVKGASLEISNSGFIGAAARRSGRAESARATTDAAGNAVFRDVFPEPVKLRVIADGFASQIDQIPAAASDGERLHEVTLARGVRMTWRLVDQDTTESIGDARLRITTGGRANDWLGLFTTDADGRVSLDLPPGRTWSVDSVPDLASNRYLELLGPRSGIIGTGPAEILLHARRATDLPMRVERSDGVPVTRCRIVRWHQSGPESVEEQSSDSSMFVLRGCETPDSPFFRVEVPDYGESDWRRIVHARKAEIPVMVLVAPGPLICGRVVGGGDISDLRIEITAVDGFGPDQLERGRRVASTRPSENGAFEIRVRKDRLYVVRATSAGRLGETIQVAHISMRYSLATAEGRVGVVREFEWTDRRIELGELKLVAAGSVEIRTVSRETPRRVWLTPRPGTAGPNLSTHTGADGVARFKAVFPGEYDVECKITSRSMPRPWRIGSPAPTVAVKPETLSTLDWHGE
jgi:hypothetical protein